MEKLAEVYKLKYRRIEIKITESLEKIILPIQKGILEKKDDEQDSDNLMKMPLLKTKKMMKLFMEV